MIVNCDMFCNLIRDRGFGCEKLLKSTNAFSVRIAPVVRSAFPGYNVNETINYANDDTIILFDGGINDNKILRYIAKENSKKKLIFYYWNPVGVSFPVDKIPKEYEIWSYSPDDCNKYGLKYNSTFYFNELVNPIEENYSFDISFIGKDKGRYPVLMKYKKMFEEAGLNTDFYVTATHPKIDHSKPRAMSYTNSLKRMSQSKCIFDYYNDPYAGLSLRMMEAIFYGKKIITNNRTVSSYDFYRKENVLILENENDKKDFLTFINTPCIKIPEEIKDFYTFESWIKRF